MCESKQPDTTGSQDRWLAIAPKPRPKGPDTKWDVFISYRSTDRAWALGLYDLLRLAGFAVFLDQLVLPSGSDLRVELQKNLKASASGVLLFSKHVAESDWVSTELSAFRNLRNQRKESETPFCYVVAKLDGTPPDLLEAADIYEDLASSPDGPRPTDVLRLMFGLIGQPLTREALDEIRSVEQEQRVTVAEVDAARRDGDIAALRELASSERPVLTQDPGLLGLVIEALISRGEYPYAKEALERALVRFPESVRLMQLQALLARRTDDWLQATRVLGRLYGLGHRDPETLGIYGAAYKVRAEKEPAERASHLRMARKYYEEGFRGDPTSHYCGVNAAGLSVELGDLEKATTVAKSLVTLLDGKPSPDRWAHASLGDAKLILGDRTGAASAYNAYALAVGYAEGDLSTTRKQITEHLAPGLGLDAAALAEVLKPLGRQ